MYVVTVKLEINLPRANMWSSRLELLVCKYAQLIFKMVFPFCSVKFMHYDVPLQVASTPTHTCNYHSWEHMRWMIFTAVQKQPWLVEPP